jgi:hypothetical protein
MILSCNMEAETLNRLSGAETDTIIVTAVFPCRKVHEKGCTWEHIKWGSIQSE